MQEPISLTPVLRAPPASRSPWALLGWLSLALLAMVAVILVSMPDVAGVRQAIRATARSSWMLFLLTFTASAQYRLWPNTWTAWLRLHRRQFGLAFVVSHLVHALAIVAFARLDPAGFNGQANTGSLVSGGIGYLFLVAMGATSFDRSAAWLGPRAWRWLHLAGAYYLWVSFLVTFGKRLPMSGFYVLPLLVLAAAMLLRWWPARRA